MSGTEFQLGDRLATDDYLRARLAPEWRDFHCLAFADLLTEVRSFAADLRPGTRLFDYGCGGAPYESIFDRCARYARADILPGPRVEILLRPDGSADEPDGSWDAILSSQVLEHVPRPAAYLAECHRMLRPGGEALVTTHGFFEEHGCPYDFHRWTAVGLEQLARDAGFEVVHLHKLTTGVRGAIQWMHYAGANLRDPAVGFWERVILSMLRRVHWTLLRRIMNGFGQRFAARCGVVPGNHPSTLYVGLALRIRKPGG